MNTAREAAPAGSDQRTRAASSRPSFEGVARRRAALSTRPKGCDYADGAPGARPEAGGLPGRGPKRRWARTSAHRLTRWCVQSISSSSTTLPSSRTLRLH